jgi:NADH:ubiquinone oxidoreductase subunit E
MDLIKVDTIIEEYRRDKSWLVMILQDIQGVHNYLPPPALRRVAERLDVGLAHVYNVATFYSSFSLVERGRHLIRVCDGTACHLRGAVNLREEITRQLGITEGETTDDRLFTLEVVACLGACALAPVMSVGSEYHGQMTVDKLEETLEALREQGAAVAVG